LWLQHLPPSEVPECGPGLEYMLDALPFTDVLAKVLHGSGECAEVLWRFLGLSIPGWSLVAFSAFLFAGLWLFFGRFRRR
jgi:disulfide bond formation protein DsbB